MVLLHVQLIYTIVYTMHLTLLYTFNIKLCTWYFVDDWTVLSFLIYEMLNNI